MALSNNAKRTLGFIGGVSLVVIIFTLLMFWFSPRAHASGGGYWYVEYHGANGYYGWGASRNYHRASVIAKDNCMKVTWGCQFGYSEWR